MGTFGNNLGNIFRFIKKVPIFLLKFVYILPFLLFGVWLLKLVYLSHELPLVEAKKADESAKVTGEDGVFKKILLQKNTVPRDHFHMVHKSEAAWAHIRQTGICSDCHKKDGYLDFKELGFAKQRIDHVNSTEIVSMIEKYKKFYLPSQIDFGIEKAVE